MCSCSPSQMASLGPAFGAEEEEVDVPRSSSYLHSKRSQARADASNHSSPVLAQHWGRGELLDPTHLSQNPHQLSPASRATHLQRSPGSAVSADDEGYVSASSWSHQSTSAFGVSPRRDALRTVLAPNTPGSASADWHSEASHEFLASVSSAAHGHELHPGGRSTLHEHSPGHNSMSIPTHARQLSPAPARPPPRSAGPTTPVLETCSPAFSDQPGPQAQTGKGKSRKEEGAQGPSDVQQVMDVPRSRTPAREDTATPPVPSIPAEHASVPIRRYASRTRSPVLSYAEGEAAEEGTDQSSDLHRMASLGPRVKKNAPAPWEVEGEEELLPPSALSTASALKQPKEWFGRKSSDVRDHIAEKLSRPSLESNYRPNLEAYVAPHAADEGNESVSGFSARSRSKSVSTSAAGMLKGLGFSTAATSKKKASKTRLGDDVKKLRVTTGGPTTSEAVPLSSTSSVFSNTDLLAASAKSVAGGDRRQGFPPERTDFRASSSNESTSHSMLTATDGSRSTAATSPAAPSFADSMPRDPSTRTIVPEDEASEGGSATSKFEASSPYRLISLEEARANQGRGREQPRQRREGSDGFSTSFSRSSVGSSQHASSQSADTRSLRAKKSGFLRMFKQDKEKVSETPTVPSFTTTAPVEVDVPDQESKPLPGPAPFAARSQGAHLVATGLAAPALSLRPMSSMFSNFEPAMLDANIAASTPESSDQELLANVGTPGAGDHLRAERRGMQSLSSRRCAPQPSEIITAPYSKSSIPSDPPSSSSNPASSSSVPVRASMDMSEGTGVFYSPVTSLVPLSDTQLQHGQRQRRDTTSHQELSRESSSNGNAISEIPPGSPATRNRVLEIEQQINHLALELAALRQQQSSALAMPDDGTYPTFLPPSSPTLDSCPNALPSQPIPPCHACGCACAEQRRRQAMFDAHAIKNGSVLERGRAVKPLGDGNTNKFGGYRNR